MLAMQPGKPSGRPSCVAMPQGSSLPCFQSGHRPLCCHRRRVEQVVVETAAEVGHEQMRFPVGEGARQQRGRAAVHEHGRCRVAGVDRLQSMVARVRSAFVAGHVNPARHVSSPPDAVQIADAQVLRERQVRVPLRGHGLRLPPVVVSEEQMRSRRAVGLRQELHRAESLAGLGRGKRCAPGRPEGPAGIVRHAIAPQVAAGERPQLQRRAVVRGPERGHPPLPATLQPTTIPGSRRSRRRRAVRSTAAHGRPGRASSRCRCRPSGPGGRRAAG